MPDWIVWTLVGLVALALVALSLIVRAASRLRRTDADARRALATFDLQLERGSRFLDDLSADVRRVADHERAILAEAEAVRELVPGVLRTDSVRDRAEVRSRLERVVDDLLAIVEAYPEVSGSPRHDAVRAQVLAAERDAAATAELHDREAAGHNALLRRSPGRLAARLAGVTERPLLGRRSPVAE